MAALRLRRSLQWKKVRDATSEAVWETYDINPDDLWSTRRYEEVAFCRQVVYYTLHRRFGLASALVGRILGKDHGTILYGTNRIEGFMEVDPALRKDIKRLVQRIEEKVEETELL
tara:strand:- start:170 stop:514 length:345 start_codon:yes stop_codon:yes gene_type:complete